MKRHLSPMTEKNSQNLKVFRFLRSLESPKVPLETILTLIIRFQWKSIRNFASDLGLSHTSVLRALKGRPVSARVKDKIRDALGFNPWAE